MSKTEKQLESDKKGKARMKKFQDKQETKQPTTGRRYMKYWRKIESGPWEEAEYELPN